MKQRQYELVKIEFTTCELRKLPPIHAGFFVGSCLAINDINVNLKVLLLALNTMAAQRAISDEALQEIAFAQAIIVQRNLAAKVFEYLNMLDAYKTLCQRKEDVSMQTFLNEADTVMSELRDGEFYDLARWYRDKVTNHYIVSELTSLIQNGDLGDDDTAHPIYLHQKDGNSSYVIGEQVLLAKLSENGESSLHRMNKLDDWVRCASKKVMKLHHDFCLQLFENHLPAKKAKAFPVTPEPHLVGQLTETCLPILWDLQSLSSSDTGK